MREQHRVDSSAYPRDLQDPEAKCPPVTRLAIIPAICKRSSLVCLRADQKAPLGTTIHCFARTQPERAR